ncbi:hypothetical protein [Nostoc sp.]
MLHNSCSLNFSSDRTLIVTSNGDRTLLISFSVSSAPLRFDFHAN